MVHPQVLLVPLMMLADYFLTVLGTVEREKKYSQHFRVQHYELNPLWQKDIAAKRWFNPRHTALVIFASAALLLAVEFVPLPRHFVQGALGCILTAYGYIVAKHVTNLLGFRHVIQKPDEVSGEVTMAHPYALAVSLYQCLAMTLPIALIAVFSASWFAYGGAIGMLLLAAAHYRWLRKARRKQAPPSPARGCSDRGQGKENEPVKGTLAIQEQSSAGGCLGELGWLGAGFVLPCASLTFYRRAARRRGVLDAAWFRPDGQILAADGEQWVGLAAVAVFSGGGYAYNGFTGVRRAYRGRGLAQALKLLAIRWARRQGVRSIRTSNDSRNAPMLAINRKLGYRPEPGLYYLMRNLA